MAEIIAGAIAEMPQKVLVLFSGRDSELLQLGACLETLVIQAVQTDVLNVHMPDNDMTGDEQWGNA